MKNYRREHELGGLVINHGKFTEHSETGSDIVAIIETMIVGIGERFGIHYGMPPHDVARRFLNEIYEYESEQERKSRLMAEAIKKEKEHADKSGG
jgi:hypothetical protein